MIRLVVLDIDGVFTDGSVYCTARGDEFKQIHFSDLDAIGRLKKQGFLVALATSENGEMIEFWKRKLPEVEIHSGCKDKLETLIHIAATHKVDQRNVCYIGDTYRDAAAITWAGFGVCPANVPTAVTSCADMVLTACSGRGAVEELANILIAGYPFSHKTSPEKSTKTGQEKIVAVIPVRGGSKRIPNKNMRRVGGQPLLGWAIQHAMHSKYIDAVYVSTDSPKLAAIAKDYGADVPFLRPEFCATDTATDLMVFKHFLEWWKDTHTELPDLLVQVRATCPLRDISDLDDAIATMMAQPEADSLRSVSRMRHSPYKAWTRSPDGFLQPLLRLDQKDWYDGPSQALPPVWVQDGMVDIIRPKTVLEQVSMAGTSILSHPTRTPIADIDTEDDLRHVDHLLRVRSAEGFEPPLHFSARLGILLGRLTQPTNGQLQCYPKDWVREFEIASELRFGHIEWLLPRGENEENPLWSETRDKRILSVIRQTGIGSSVICLDPLLDIPIIEASTSQIYQLAEGLRQAAAFGAEGAVFPLMEASKLGADLDVAVRGLERFGAAVKSLGVRLHLEISAESTWISSLMEKLDPALFGYCFDTGNLRAHGINEVTAFADLYEYISHIHIKDVLANGERKLLGDGIVDFKAVVRMALKRSYTGRFTLETPRGDNPVETANKHRSLLIDLANEYYTGGVCRE